jgi:hypothetical protein
VIAPADGRPILCALWSPYRQGQLVIDRDSLSSSCLGPRRRVSTGQGTTGGPRPNDESSVRFTGSPGIFRRGDSVWFQDIVNECSGSS